MKKTLAQYLVVFLIFLTLVVVMLMIAPKKQNQLEFIEKRIDDIQAQREILTEKEKELERLATEKEWEEVDKGTDK
jgi:short subunit fatty acids transporter